MSTTPPQSPGGDPAALGPQDQAATQSAATQDLDRRLQEIADEYATQQQALQAVMEERRKELLVADGQGPNMISPERLSAGGSSSTGNWERVPDLNTPPVGNSSTGSGAPHICQPTTRQAPPPPQIQVDCSTAPCHSLHTVGRGAGWNKQKKPLSMQPRVSRIFKLSFNHVWMQQLQKLCDNRQKMQVQRDSQVMVLFLGKRWS